MKNEKPIREERSRSVLSAHSKNDKIKVDMKAHENVIVDMVDGDFYNHRRTRTELGFSPGEQTP